MSQNTCCPPGAKPYLKEDPNYAPQGEIVTFDDVRAYKVGTGCISFVFLHDIFGLESGLNKLLCDSISLKHPEFTVIAPDLFPLGNLLDEPIKERGAQHLKWKVIYSALVSCRLWGYFAKYSWDNITGDIFNKTTTLLVTTLNCTQIITCGVCWGSFFAFKACSLAQHKDLIIGNISVHPSADVLAARYSEDWRKIVNDVNCPQMIAATLGEGPDWKPSGEVERILSDKSFVALNKYYDYSEEHGFFTRGDTAVPATSEAIGDCLLHIDEFSDSVIKHATESRK